jgi:hydrogenase maturation protein HypF
LSTGKPESTSSQATRLRRRYDFRGRVQGVGFRPWIYRLATECGLTGHVGNDPRGASVEVEGSAEAIAAFIDRSENEAPPLVEIGARDEIALEPVHDRDFSILSSRQGGEQRAEITPDSATCPDCLREMRDPGDRRHRYPFINCTNCGPRYSIVKSVPYDRVSTTMAAFTMCPACQAEYDDPADRRFHAQPNACPVCGPQVWLTDRSGARQAGDAITETVRRLLAGAIVAIKGLGGFHLACRADRELSVSELRSRKGREAKPLAVMVGGLEAARALVHLDEAAAALLAGTARPIVLAPARAEAEIASAVAPGTHTLGVMLPYTPLHSLLFETAVDNQTLGPLVMTSGNPSAEPLCHENDEALRRLAEIADAFLLHDRDIERRVDDSVALSLQLPGEEARTTPLRRARGYAPSPVALGFTSETPVLALGGELKSAVCLLKGDEALLSEHLGDLDNPAAYRNFVGTVERLQTLFDCQPTLAAADLHPAYAASRFAGELPIPIEKVQHHHAHIVSCMADNGIRGEVLGIACDGTGFGTDGAIWGCELLLADERGFTRAGHLRNFSLLGGDAAARETWRPAAGLLAESYGADWPGALPGFSDRVDADALALATRFLAAPAPPTVQTSSLGRLFDAVAFLLGLCDHNHAEAQAPMALEAAAAAHGPAPALPFELVEEGDGLLLDYRPLIKALVEGLRAGRSAGELAAGFHHALAELLAAAADRILDEHGERPVMLSGGCFANRLLTEELAERLMIRERDVYIHHRVPAGDGGLALGQAVCAAARAAGGRETSTGVHRPSQEN